MESIGHLSAHGTPFPSPAKCITAAPVFLAPFFFFCTPERDEFAILFRYALTNNAPLFTDTYNNGPAGTPLPTTAILRSGPARRSGKRSLESWLDSSWASSASLGWGWWGGGGVYGPTLIGSVLIARIFGRLWASALSAARSARFRQWGKRDDAFEEPGIFTSN